MLPTTNQQAANMANMGPDVFFKSADMWYRSFRNSTIYGQLRIIAAICFGFVVLFFLLGGGGPATGVHSEHREGEDRASEGLMEATEILQSRNPPMVSAPLPAMLYVVALVALGGLAFAAWLAAWVLGKDEGDEKMRQVSDAIREGAAGFLSTQYASIFKLAVVVLVGIFLMYLLREPPKNLPQVASSRLALCVAVSFATGCILSGVAGYVGMWVAVRSNVRVASAACRSFQEAIDVGLRAGAFSGVLVVSMVLLGIIALLFGVRLVVPAALHQLPFLLVGYGFGASFVALFAQLGGGIYTKAADVGADMVGKVEADIPEDDPRNPAVIADLVGDNVGDCAGRGADLFESIAGEILAAMILGGTLSQQLPPDARSGYVLFPLAIHAMDLIVSGIGIMMTEAPKGKGIKGIDPMEVLKSGYKVSVGLAAVGIVVLCRLLLYTEEHPTAWMNFSVCGLVGLGTAFLFILVTQYYTDFNFPPVRQIAQASVTGHGTNVIAGMSVGMRATAAPAGIICVALLCSYKTGMAAFGGSASAGLFGTAVATMGMLSTVVFVLAMDVFGPITDNAGGIVEMSEQPESVRNITDSLDAVGNTTKAITKGFSVGSASLACFLLFSAFLDEVSELAGQKVGAVDISVPEVFLGGIAGATLVFYFSGQCMTAVGSAAQEVVNNVRTQFRERPGIMDGSQKPDYASCVSIVTKAALREMVAPGIVATTVPLCVGFFFRVASSGNDRLIGAKAIASFPVGPSAFRVCCSIEYPVNTS
ncbi:AVPL2 [Symbiodinium natans]|uniref:H(+)-exporting diphosphatase n=1 Tax=Symbiodinium natans TaxID=878477 RepID=A0A812N8Q4_9DINO|nr:AVPL2 [Symbiodinium natans]